MMNSSFLFLGSWFLALLTLVYSGLLLFQFGFPRDTIRSLGLLFMVSLGAMLLIDALTYCGVFVVFYYPAIYGVLIGIMGFAWPSFVWLGVLDHPTQLQRKIMWRLPILGALLGHALGSYVTVMIFALGWIAAFITVIYYAKTQRYVLRNLVTMLLVSVVYFQFVRSGTMWAGQLCFALWIVFTHRIVNAFMVKNLVRQKSDVPLKEVSA